MNYQETLDFLYHQLPVFTRDGEKAYKKDLINTLALCKALGHPERKFRSVHVAGTNGKGSTSHSLAAILQEAGYNTGLYTSPHLVDFRERIRINGTVVSEDWVGNFVEKHQDLITRIQPSFFELTVAMAYTYFSEQSVDIAVIETGMGGRLDSTNVIQPEVSVITNIGMDHANILGHTLGEIAHEKAGIIKAGVPVVVSEFQPEVAEIFMNRATELGAPLTFASKRFTTHILDRNLAFQRVAVSVFEQRPSGMNEAEGILPLNNRAHIFQLQLLGTYQTQNLPGILAAVECLQSSGWRISLEQVKRGLEQVVSSTGLRGRWEILQSQPLLICDTGHNEDGWKVVLQNVAATPHSQLRIVLGVMRDKDLEKMLPLLPQQAIYYFCEVAMPRALPALELASVARDRGLFGQAYSSVQQAVEAALNEASIEDLVFVGGSTFIVGGLLEVWPFAPSGPVANASFIP